MRSIIAYTLLSLLVLLLQTTIVPFISIATIVPDLLLVWIVYIAIREGQFAATAAGFLLGLLVDLLAGQDGMPGLSAFAKTLAGFAAGYFYNETRTQTTLGGSRLLVAIAVASVVHNAFYFLIFLQGTDVGWWGGVIRFGIPTTVYTVCAGLLPMFFFGRKYQG